MHFARSGCKLYDLPAGLCENTCLPNWIECVWDKTEIVKCTSFQKLNVTKLNQILGSDYIVKDRMKQDEAFLKIMKLEKWLFTLFSLNLILVSLYACWYSMDDRTRKAKGCEHFWSHWVLMILIRNKYFSWLESGHNLWDYSRVCNIICILFFAKKKYKLIGVPEEFIIDSYPMQMRFTDFILVAFVVLAIGTLATLLPVKKKGN